MNIILDQFEQDVMDLALRLNEGTSYIERVA